MLIAAAAAFYAARAAAKANKLLEEERWAADDRLARSYTLPLLSEIFSEFRTKELSTLTTWPSPRPVALSCGCPTGGEPSSCHPALELGSVIASAFTTCGTRPPR